MYKSNFYFILIIYSKMSSKFDNETILYMLDSIKNHITTNKKAKTDVYEADDDDDRVVKGDWKEPIGKPKNLREQYKCTCGMLLKNKSGVPYEMHIKSKYHIENSKKIEPKRKPRSSN